jgi:hypothetical protein
MVHATFESDSDECHLWIIIYLSNESRSSQQASWTEDQENEAEHLGAR